MATAGQSQMKSRAYSRLPMRRNIEQEVVVAPGAGELAADGSLVGMHPRDVQSQPANHRQTGGGVALAVAHLVLVHRHGRGEQAAPSFVSTERRCKRPGTWGAGNTCND